VVGFFANVMAITVLTAAFWDIAVRPKGGNRRANRSKPTGTTMTTQTTTRSPLGSALRACYPALATTFVLSMFINASMLASPLYSMQIYDRVLTSRNVGTLTMLTMIVGMFLVLYGILEFARSGVLARAGVQFERTLRH